MKSTRTPFRGMYSTLLSTVGNQGGLPYSFTQLPGNTIPAVANTIIIPRDGWYRITLDILYQNAAGTQGYGTVFINGALFMQFVTTEPSAALAPQQGMSRNVWCKAGDRITMTGAHNESSAVVRNLLGNFFVDEVMQ